MFLARMTSIGRSPSVYAGGDLLLRPQRAFIPSIDRIRATNRARSASEGLPRHARGAETRRGLGLECRMWPAQEKRRVIRLGVDRRMHPPDGFHAERTVEAIPRRGGTNTIADCRGSLGTASNLWCDGWVRAGAAVAIAQDHSTRRGAQRNPTNWKPEPDLAQEKKRRERRRCLWALQSIRMCRSKTGVTAKLSSSFGIDCSFRVSDSRWYRPYRLDDATLPLAVARLCGVPSSQAATIRDHRTGAILSSSCVSL